jgi:enoyl-CoA hydratase
MKESAVTDYETILYATDGPVATITLNRPKTLNTIVPPMPDEVEAAVNVATRDPAIKVIVVRGAGRAFCAGYDFGGGFKEWEAGMNTDGRWDPGKDFALTTQPQTGPTQKFLSIWRTSKPVIAQIHGWCVGGGSDFALGADLVIASEDAVIGTPYSRLWGAYLSGMWIYRLGLARAKYHALTGRPLNGKQAVEAGLINEAVPFEQLEDRVRELAVELAGIPSSQLAAMKLCVNHAYEQQGLGSVQVLGSILDGLMRNTPDALRFVERAAGEGVGAVIADRDGPFGDYSQAPPDQRPNPDNVITP